jgi:acetate kinase
LAASGGRTDHADLTDALASLNHAGSIEAVGHRIVHGGGEFTAPVVVNAEIRARLAALVDLAPLHQPKSLAAMDAVSAALPDIPAVACFDTAFHATMPPEATTYAVPEDWRRRYAVRRYGFHGLSHAYASHRAAEITGARRVVTCHLGAGASLAAVRDGVSQDTTMGFTPLEGLVMATRSGSVDPGLVLWLANHEGLAPDELAESLEHRSGLLALAGTADMRDVVAMAAQGRPRGVLALDVYLHSLCAGVAAMAASLGGLDAVVFTGGVGENAATVRAAAAARLTFLGLAVDPEANAMVAVRSDDPTADADVSAADARVRTLVIASREDLQIARDMRAILGAVGAAHSSGTEASDPQARSDSSRPSTSR